MNLNEWRLQDALGKLEQDIANLDTADHEARTTLRNAYLSKKQGLVNKLYAGLRQAAKEDKPRLGKELNTFRGAVNAAFKAIELSKSSSEKGASLDLTLPGVHGRLGSLHPLTLTMNAMVSFFVNMGYDVGEGPEIESLFYNFEALNTPADHPAREDADTFYINDDHLLRTQTSGVQIRYMQTMEPPFRMVAPGRVFRRDDDVTHSPMFHQLEGLVVAEDISLSHLKGTLEAFARYIFGPNTQIRLRPSFFPFTEPSAEVDATCPFCDTGCRVCKGTCWIEILGCGMVDPNVFAAASIDPERYTGFAFGMGIERVAMLKYSVPDIRYFYQNDRRFLDHFKVVG